MQGAMPYNSQTNLEQSPLRLPPKLSGDLCKKDGECRPHLQRDHGHTDSQSSTETELHSTCSLSPIPCTCPIPACHIHVCAHTQSPDQRHTIAIHCVLYIVLKSLYKLYVVRVINYLFLDEETGSEMRSHLPEVTELENCSVCLCVLIHSAVSDSLQHHGL